MDNLCRTTIFEDLKEKNVKRKTVGQYIEIAPNVEIYYESMGSGAPIVFIPGWTFTTEVFEHQMSHFSKTHQAITYDPRSHGRSSKTLEGNNYTTHGTDLIKFLEKLELSDVTLVAWSFGCLALWEYVRQRNLKNIKSVVCIDLPPKCLSVNSDDWVEGPLDEIAGAYNAFLGSSAGQRNFVIHYATELMIQRELKEDELFWINEQSLKTPHYIAANLFASGMFSNYIDEAKKIDDNLPALYVVAEHWAETAKSYLDKNFPKSSVETLGGHMMFWEYPDQFNQLVDKFIAS